MRRRMENCLLVMFALLAVAVDQAIALVVATYTELVCSSKDHPDPLLLVWSAQGLYAGVREGSALCFLDVI
jgi:hypothetical protein